MSNKTIYNILIRHNLNQVKPVLQDIIDEMRTIQQTRIQLDARNINSMYLDNHQYAWNIFRGITPNHSIQEDDFKYANGDIDIDQLLDALCVDGSSCHGIVSSFKMLARTCRAIISSHRTDAVSS